MARVPEVDVFACGRGVTAARVRCSAGPRDRPFAERHARSAIAVVRRGFFTYHRDGRAHALGPGFVLLGNAGDHFMCSHELGTGDDCVSFAYDDAALEEIARAVAGRPRARVFGAPFAAPDPRIAALVRGLEAGEVSVDEVALSVAALVLREPARRTPAPSTRARRERIAAACRFIRDHASENVSLDDIAAAVDLSPFHFLRTFRAEVGMTPHQYLIGARLENAVTLLRDTARPITRVAFDAGFGDVSNFINTFRRRLGSSPGVFRDLGSVEMGRRLVAHRGGCAAGLRQRPPEGGARGPDGRAERLGSRRR
jgi:AraC-like DNA-binding protein